MRSFLRLGLQFSEQGYETIWRDLEGRPATEDTDLFALMDDATDGLTGFDFDWLLMNLVVRDCVTLFEVYLEKVLYEFVSFRVHGLSIAEKAPTWSQLKSIYERVFGINLAPQPVADVIALRHLLTHRRGELRTDEQRERYDTREFGFPDISVRLQPPDVVGYLDVVASHIAEIDTVMYPLAWGREPINHEMHDALLLAAPWLFS